MSRRHSMISHTLNGVISTAMERHRHMRMHAALFSADELVHTTLGESIAQLDAFKEALPSHARKLFQNSTTNTLTLILPLRTHPPTFKRMYGGHTELMKLSKYRDLGRPTEGRAPVLRALGFQVRSPVALPLKYQYSRDDDDIVDTAEDGIILTPSILGEEMYGRYEKAARQMDELILNLNYMRGFAKGVSQLCTTEGITKRLWPECTTFLSGGLKGKIERAKVQPYPTYAKKALSDFSGLDYHPSKAYLHKQLKGITDVILAAQLMPDVNKMEELDKKKHCTINEVVTLAIKKSFVPDELKSLVE